MKQLSYAEKLKSPKWQKKRLEIMNRDKFACKLCGDTKTQLHIHHIEYDNSCEPWECRNDILVTLCEDCHKVVEELKEDGVHYSEIKIYKSNTWDTETTLMFVYYNGICSMNSYDKNKNFLVGYFLPKREIENIMRFLKIARHGQEIY